jgi:DNA polymerase III subunit gamma/tau
MSYVVLARKWRPQQFEDVIGQEHVARTLTNAIHQDRVAHAFLFCGPRGVGKTSTARILAKALNCKQGPTATPCYNCASCDEVSRGTAVDVFEIDGASNRGVGEIRELREGVNYSASRDRYKIYIIDEVHMLTTEAFNALLKTLEEPPPHVKFIFATTEPQKIPVTILSRCQRFDFKRIPVRKIVGLLEKITAAEGIHAEAAALSLIARQADGGGRDALSLTDQVVSFTSGQVTEAEVAEILGVASRELLFRLSGALLHGDVETALSILDEVHHSGHDVQQFAAALVAHQRDLTVVRVTGGGGRMTDLTEAELATARDQVASVEPSVLHRSFHLMVLAAEEMSQSTWPKLLFEMALVKLASIEPLVPIDLLVKRLETLESGILIGEPPEGGSNAAAPSSPPMPPAGPAQTPTAKGAASAAPAATPTRAEAAPVAARQGAATPTVVPEPPPEAAEATVVPEPPPEAAEATVVPEPPPEAAEATVVPEPPPEAAEATVVPEAPREGAETAMPAVPPDAAETPSSEPPPHRDEDAPAMLSGPPGPEPPPFGDQGGSTRQPARPPEAAPQARQTKQAPIATGPVAIPGRAPQVAAPPRVTTPAPIAEPPDREVLDPAEAREAWKSAVRELRGENGQSPPWCLHARIHEIRPGYISLQFAEEHHFLVNEQVNGLALSMAATTALADIWADTWAVRFAVTDAAVEHEQRSLHHEATEVANRLRAGAREVIANHELVAAARDIFSPAKVRIVLDEQDLYSWDQI